MKNMAIANTKEKKKMKKKKKNDIYITQKYLGDG
jgi:hypothetical protein